MGVDSADHLPCLHMGCFLIHGTFPQPSVVSILYKLLSRMPHQNSQMRNTWPEHDSVGPASRGPFVGEPDASWLPTEVGEWTLGV